MTSHAEFDSRFQRQLVKAYRHQLRNKRPANKLKLLRTWLQIAASYIIGYRIFEVMRHPPTRMAYFLSQMNNLRMLYTWLNDDYSKSLMIELVVRKILGPEHLEALVDPTDEEARRVRSEPLIVEQKTGSSTLGNTVFELNLYDLSSLGYPLKAHLFEGNVVHTFMSEQYRYKHGEVDIGVEPGDIAIDAGGCWGDTALYMAAREAGRVYSFEFVPDNLQIFSRNLAENTALSEVIDVVEKAVWDEDDTFLTFESRGPATKLGDSANQQNRAETITIDKLVSQEPVQKVDFIKMDIEGAELRAIEGATETIRTFAPKLAITVYHKIEDLCTIPHLIKSLQPNYNFYLDHFTTNMMETVLFAEPIAQP